MAYLILADGTIYQGKSIGAKGSSIGETVFTTGMTGYLETLTDPSYFGQIVTQTFPLIGNYGVINEDFESSKSWVKGYIVRELCDSPSNFRCNGNLDSYLKEQNIVGICDIDTRALTKKLREAGVMNGMIISDDNCPEITESLLQQIKSYRVEQSVETVSTSTTKDTKQPIVENYPDTNKHITKIQNKHIVLWDFGAKNNIQRELEKRGAKVTVVPYSFTAEQILSLNPDGIMLSNGPGDPSDNIGIIEEIKKLCEVLRHPELADRHPDPSNHHPDSSDRHPELVSRSPSKPFAIFGICLGHQMLALARGAKTSKLKYGHRGGNHPVKDLETERVYISSQNHGYAVENESLPSYAKLAFVNSNDNTCEGITYTDIPAFSVQFHPEACGGPHDTNYLFDRFIEMI